MLRLLFDAGVGRAAERAAAAGGHDVRSVLDVDPAMEDGAILRLAALEERIIVTMDRDFGQLAFESGMSHAGVLLLRLDSANGPEKAAILTRLLGAYGDQLAGVFAVLQGDRLRLRS